MSGWTRRKHTREERGGLLPPPPLVSTCTWYQRPVTAGPDWKAGRPRRRRSSPGRRRLFPLAAVRRLVGSCAGGCARAVRSRDAEWRRLRAAAEEEEAAAGVAELGLALLAAREQRKRHCWL